MLLSKLLEDIKDKKQNGAVLCFDAVLRKCGTKKYS